MSDKSEERIIEYETALNKAMDDWFNARPSIVRTHEAEIIYAGGFRMANNLRGNDE